MMSLSECLRIVAFLSYHSRCRMTWVPQSHRLPAPLSLLIAAPNSYDTTHCIRTEIVSLDLTRSRASCTYLYRCAMSSTLYASVGYVYTANTQSFNVRRVRHCTRREGGLAFSDAGSHDACTIQVPIVPFGYRPRTSSRRGIAVGGELSLVAAVHIATRHPAYPSRSGEQWLSYTADHVVSRSAEPSIMRMARLSISHI